MTILNKIHQLFELQTTLYPDKVCIIFESESLTYTQLNSKANQLARYLANQGVKSGDFVPIISEKSINTVIAILAILKLDAAYVPINLDFSQEAIDSIISDLNAKAVFIHPALQHKMINNSIFKIDIEDLSSLTIAFDESNYILLETFNENAYVIYTSGTTGKSKGVVVTHQNLLNTYYSWEQVYQLSPNDNHLQMANIAFDVFTGDWVRALCSGGKLVLCPKEILLQPESLYNLIKNRNINCAEFVPAILRLLLIYVQNKKYDLAQFRILICGSDQWTMGEYRMVQSLCNTDAYVINSYGLTEACIDSTYYPQIGGTADINLPATALVPAGYPFPHANIYLFDAEGQEVAPGEIGEIYIGGSGVAKEYLKQTEMTNERFVYITIAGVTERVYRTGDMGRLSMSGALEFLGRNQMHVKIHGKRIELPPIEERLNQYPKIKQAIIAPCTDDKNEIILKTFVSLSDESLSYEELINYLKKYFSDYSIPREFYIVNDLTLTPNGKINRDIVSQQVVGKIEPKLLSPCNNWEEKLLSIWKKVLGKSNIGVNNNFCELGGSSLTYAIMLAEVSQMLGWNLELQNIQIDTIQDLANYIHEKMDASFNEDNIYNVTSTCASPPPALAEESTYFL